MTEDLPVKKVLPELLNALRASGAALLEAPPGAGKSTLVPPALLESGLAGEKKVYLLEPRRLAARSLAHFIARSWGEGVGERCGYRVHRESRVSPRTRLEVITEGILIRMLQSDPSLEEAGAIIFDEFHERNLLSDLALTLLLESRESLREDLVLLFMSATPDPESLEKLLPGLPLIRSRGRQFPVEKIYRPQPDRGRIAPVPADTVGEALRGGRGDVLVFLPGEGEIKRWQGILSRELGEAEVLALYGRMPLEQQNRIVSPEGPRRKRRIILSTDIAETSLTIPGVTAVVDTGLARRPQYNPSSGLTLLTTEEISLASAEQRSGRAGRTEPGVCYRLWERESERGRDLQTPPEILQADLSPLVLELALWGCSDRESMKWMTPPPPAAWEGGRSLLILLGALDREGRLTPRGRSMGELPLHPRMAALMLYGRDRGIGREAALLAAYLEARDFLPPSAGSDLLLRLDYLTGDRPAGEWERPVREIRAEAEHLYKNHFSESFAKGYDRNILRDEGASLLAQAFPDRIGLRVGEGIYQLSGGGRVLLDQGDPLSVHPLVVAAHCGGHRERQKLFLGLPLERREAEKLFEGRILSESHGRWDRERKRIRSEVRRRLGEITLSVTAEGYPGPERGALILSDGIRSEGKEILPWDRESRRLYERMVFAGNQKGAGEWPDLTDRGLADTAGEWLVPFLEEGRLTGSLTGPLLSLLRWEQQQELERIAPDSFRTALGNRRKIVYGEGEPYLPLPLQEMYGTGESPLLGKKPLVLHLLNPAGRPVQVTADLKSFWANGWAQVRSELRGRYPRHYWPEDPASSAPSLSTGKRRPD